MTWPSDWPEDRWDVVDPAPLDIAPGPETVLCTPPAAMPPRRSAGFTADLEVTDRAGEQTHH